MEEVKRIPYGVSNFVEVVEQNQYYVDKTMYLPLLEKQPSNLFFIRPRRFGKSIFLSMLRTYYDIAQKEKFEKRFSNFLHSCKGLSKYSFLISPEWEGLTERLPKTLMITVAADWMILLLSMNPIIIPALKRK